MGDEGREGRNGEPHGRSKPSPVKASAQRGRVSAAVRARSNNLSEDPMNLRQSTTIRNRF
jgi:hypothetical protein